MSRVYQNLGLPPEASALTVVRTAIRRLHPSPPKRADLPPLATHFDPTDGASGFSF
jgi:hypothetical protein